jgi:hypothetical protein
VKPLVGATTRLGKFHRLPSAERWLIVEAALALGTIRLGLWLLTLRRVRQVAAWAYRRTSFRDETDRLFPERVGWAIARVSPYIPRATCLVQALAVQFLLDRRGYSPVLRIGLARGGQKRVDGHAWVELQGEVIIGRAFSSGMLLPPFEMEKPNGG